MKKILICLPSEYYKKYIELNAFKELQKNFEVCFLLNKDKWSSNINSKKIFAKNIKKIFYSIDKKENVFFLKTIQLFLVANRKLSKTFNYSYRKLYPGLKDFIKIEKTKRRDKLQIYTKSFLIKTFFRFFYKPFLRKFLVDLLSYKGIFKFYKNSIISKIKINSQISEIIKKIKPDLIIYTTHCYEPEAFMIPKIAREAGSKTFFLVDNWDNISCKTVFFNKPDFLGVWGEQSKKHAIKIQKIREKNIFLMGSPKFDNYFLIRKEKLPNIFKHQYVLFFGLVELYDDIKVLERLDNEIYKNPKKYKNLKVVYRPHPSRPNLHLHTTKIKSFKNIILDPNMNKFLKSKNKKYLENKNFYFEKLLSNSLFNLGGITTVTIESLIFKKKQIFLCHDEKDSISDPKTLFKVNLHFEKLDRVSALSKANSINSVVKQFRKTYLTKSFQKISKNLDKEINFYYNVPSETYSKRIYSAVNKINL
jgi:hypothetical protein